MAWCGCHEILIALCYPQEVFCLDQKMSKSKNFSHLDDRRITQRSQSNTTWRDKKSNREQWKGLSRVPVYVSSLNRSLFLGFPLWSNVDSGRCWFVVQNWIIPPPNGNLLEVLSRWIEKSFFPCNMTWFAYRFFSFTLALGYFVCWSANLCLSSTVQDTAPRRRSLLMLVLSHSDTH